MSHLFVPILRNVLNYKFAQGAISSRVTKVVIILLKKSDMNVWEGRDDYCPITLLNTVLNVLARILANSLQIVDAGLIGPEQDYEVKER